MSTLSQDNHHLHAEFYLEAAKNEKRSVEESRPIFEDVEYVKIRIAGDKGNVFVAPAKSQGSAFDPSLGRRMTYAEQFPEHYDAFKRHVNFREAGTPLEALGLAPFKIAELNGVNVFTVEALASLDGALLEKLGMGARALKDQASAFLKKSTDNAALLKMQQENDALRDRLERMEQVLSSKTAPAQATAPVDSTSPFQEWDEDAIKAWLADNAAPTPHHKAGHAKLVALADEWNAKLAADLNGEAA
jgi:predicted transcriptional regulator